MFLCYPVQNTRDPTESLDFRFSVSEFLFPPSDPEERKIPRSPCTQELQDGREQE